MARGAVAAVLAGLIAAEGVVLGGQPTAPRAIALAAGVVVCLCAVPWPGVRLEVRGTVAAAVSLATTVVLLSVDRSLRDWGLGESLALLLLLGPVLRRSAAPTAARLGAALAVAAVGAPARDAHPGPFTLAAATMTALVCAHTLSLRAYDTRRLAELRAVRGQERRELARELHDLVAHHIAGIVVLAQAGRWTGADGPGTEAFARIEKEGDEALASMHRLVGLLRDSARTEPVAGLKEVRELVDTFSRTGPPAEFDLAPGLAARVDRASAAAVHRVVREALTNVRRHARDATWVKVSLEPYGADGLRLTVRDDGRSAAPAPESQGGGFGVAGMAERVEALGGSLTAGPGPEGGWQVQALLPATLSAARTDRGSTAP
ncbi:sensor histidine kinase [Streptomyces mangrovisoli]|uniref:histidine kinase n=1 Tax=Streptomyces mangrovisoli TaxID=1428628 RepID=A0A1J4NMS9_9ACTN|nr:histidine kinase [Streptomyces mangrovisoli]OIJ63584.1 hypothetical protein WN71_032690 [Streptomyces mangrovisoli]